MNSVTVARQYRLTRPGGLGFFRRRSAPQFAICCAGIGLCLLAVVLSGTGVVVRVAVGVCGLLVFGFGAGRTTGGEDFVSLAGPVVHHSGRRLSGHHRWSAALSVWGGAELPPIFSGITLYDLDDEERTLQGAGRIGLVADRADGSLSCVLRVHGEGFLLADDDEKDARLASFGDALGSLARQESPVARLAWSQLVSPAPVSGHLAYLASTKRTEPDESIAASYEALVEDTAARAVSSEVLVTLTVAGARARSGSERFFSGIDSLLEEAQLFSAELSRAGLVALGPLPAGVIARSLRDRLDPTSRLELDRRGRSLGDLCGLVTPENGFPLSIQEHASAIETDRSWHRVFRVAEWPHQSLRADWLCGYLCEKDVTRSLTVLYTPLDRRLARRQALATATRVGASIDERELKGRRVGAEERRAHEAAEALDEELESGAAMELVVGLVDVVAGSKGELDEACARSRQSAANVGIELRPVSLRQGEALVASLPLGRIVPGRPR